MTSKAYVYCSEKDLLNYFSNRLKAHAIDVLTIQNLNKDSDYFFAILKTEEDIIKIQSFVELFSKVVIAAPREYRRIIESKYSGQAKLFFYSELLLANLAASAGPLAKMLIKIKSKSVANTFNDDFSLDVVVYTDLVDSMINSCLGFYSLDSEYIYQPVNLNQMLKLLANNHPGLKLNDFQKKATSSVQPKSIKLNKINRQYENIIAIFTAYIAPKKDFSIDLDLNIDFPKFIKGGLAAAFFFFIPYLSFMLSLFFLYLGKVNLESNNRISKASFAVSEKISRFNSDYLELIAISNSYKSGVRASIIAAQIGSDLVEDDYSSLFKNTSFYEVDPSNSEGLFTNMVKSLDLVEESRQKILALSQVSPIKDKLLGLDSETKYLIVNIKDDLAVKATAVGVKNSKIVQSSEFSSSEADSKILGLVDPPKGASEYLSDAEFGFRYVDISSNFADNAENAAWFAKNAFSIDSEIVVFVYDLEIELDDSLNNQFVEKLFYGFKEGSIKAFSFDRQINSVLLDLNRLGSV